MLGSTRADLTAEAEPGEGAAQTSAAGSEQGGPAGGPVGEAARCGDPGRLGAGERVLRLAEVSQST